MARMLPWIRTFWAALNEDDKKEIAKYARIIRKTAVIDSARETCFERLEELCARYAALRDDCARILRNEDFADVRIVPMSDIEHLVNYFGQFSDLYPEENWGQDLEDKGARKFLVRNGYHGDIICTLQEETPTAYFFKYIKDGVEMFADWRVLKRSGRVLEEIFD